MSATVLPDSAPPLATRSSLGPASLAFVALLALGCSDSADAPSATPADRHAPPADAEAAFASAMLELGNTVNRFLKNEPQPASARFWCEGEMAAPPSGTPAGGLSSSARVVGVVSRFRGSMFMNPSTPVGPMVDFWTLTLADRRMFFTQIDVREGGDAIAQGANTERGVPEAVGLLRRAMQIVQSPTCALTPYPGRDALAAELHFSPMALINFPDTLFPQVTPSACTAGKGVVDPARSFTSGLDHFTEVKVVLADGSQTATVEGYLRPDTTHGVCVNLSSTYMRDSVTP